MKCPYCPKIIHFEPWHGEAFEYNAPLGKSTGFDVSYGSCPSCEEIIVLLRNGIYRMKDSREFLETIHDETIVYPKHATSREIPSEVPEQYKKDFNEAEIILPLSPKASAAIGRRLLQRILRDEYKLGPSNLAKEIEDFIQLPRVPSNLTQAVDVVRNVGNFAAHPLKDTNTGEIVNVEPGEADWILDVLESLFDFTFVQPMRLKERKEKLNTKLASIGKPPMKNK